MNSEINSNLNKKVLVTGADGFIGSHLVEELVGRGHRVRAFCYYNSFGHCGWLDRIDPCVRSSIEVVSGDIRDGMAVKAAVEGVDEVFHLAALIAIPYSYVAPESYVDTNVKGTMHVLNACRDLKVSRLLVTSTSEVYGTAQFVPITEAHPRQGQSPYSATKIAADALADSYYRSFDLPVTIVRPFNTFGPRQSARAFIPTIIVQLLSGMNVIKLGSLSPTRDLLFVKDTVKAFVALAEAPEAIGREVNISTGSEVSVGDVAQTLIDVINPEAKIELDKSRLRPSKSEVERLCGSSDLLSELTDWKPQCSFREGLDQTVEWFRVSSNRADYREDIYVV